MKKIACVAALVLACAPVLVFAEDLQPNMKTPETENPKEKKEKPEAKRPQENKPEEKKQEQKKPEAKKPELITPWDIAFGGTMMSDYNFRGITQSNHRPAVTSYFEPRYNFDDSLQGYFGLAGESISFPNRAPSEIDLYGGVRPTFGNLALDFGAWYYWYPGGECFHNLIGECRPSLTNGNVVKADLSFWEAYAKAIYAMNGQFWLGGGVYWSPSVFNSGAEGTYLAGTARYILPPVLPKGIGSFISADVGHWFLGTSDSFYAVRGFPGGIPYKSYTTWDVGLAFTWKQFTLDLRYYDTNLNKGDCNAFTKDFTAGGVFSTAINPAGPGSNWCGATFLAKLSVDLTRDNLKKREERTSEEKKPDMKGRQERRSEDNGPEMKGRATGSEDKKPEDKKRADKKPEDKNSEDKNPKDKKPEDKKPELKNPWDIAFGTAIMSEFNIRGVSGSNHRPAVEPYFEPRYNFSDSLQAYVRLWGNPVAFPNRAAVAINLWAGTRPTFGKLALDYGFWQRWFPGGECVDPLSFAPCGTGRPLQRGNVIPADLNFWEIFARATYHVNDRFSVGGGAYWSPSVFNTGDPATYVMGTAKYILPTIRPWNIGWLIFGEMGHWYREGTPYPSYTNWYAGLAFTWKQFTFDLRYSDTNRPDCLTQTANAVLLEAAGIPRSDRCGKTFIGKLSVDLTRDNLR
ncbi:MAG TPA: TorF family putative porin [Xanthobacteraceae bacterium]|jgi:hypothetical protein|nr:TorF family putative porin [Xanthobacteraceae bacterium]